VLDGLAGAAQRRTEIFSQSSIIMDRTSRNFERILDTIMAQYSSIVPTITVHQGHKMKIYLSDDVLISPYAEIKDRSYYAHR
jgi:type IV secretory pathway VirB10-like protein